MAKVKGRDFFGAPRREEAEKALALCRGSLEEFAAKIYKEEEER